jgi:dienelactone hydrolase
MAMSELLDAKHRAKVGAALAVCLVVLLGAALTASLTQRDFGRVEVRNVRFENSNGIPIRAKLFRPLGATAENPAPGVVYIHGYQNNRETGDAYCIELARRGFVVLNIDAIGRGNSGLPGDPDAPDFDVTYGGKTAFAYLKALPFVDADRAGMMGHSLGAEMAYTVALGEPSVRALVISGFAYTLDASDVNPTNMLMILGRWDEYRKRMTGTRDFEAEWMDTPQTRQVIPVESPQFSTTYGDFMQGTARRVFMPNTTHVQESHSRAAIAEAVLWMRDALQPSVETWIDANRQIWALKEWSTLVAMLASFASLLPLGVLLLQVGLFKSLQGKVSGTYACTGKAYWRRFAVNGLLAWLYLPLIFVLFGLHVYVVHIDRVFPMMMVNGIVWWFVWSNVIGYALFRRWFKKRQAEGLTLTDLGVAYGENKWRQLGLSLLLAAILIAFAYVGEHLLERLLIVDFRFIFPFASDLTPYRFLMFLLYLPFLALGFVLNGVFLHGQLRRPRKDTWLKTYVSWTGSNLFATIAPISLFLLLQYVPLFLTGFIPFVGPGGMFVSFVINLFHIIGVLAMAAPISTWFYMLTGKIYLGAFVNAMLVAWMFASSQVIAPLPI